MWPILPDLFLGDRGHARDRNLLRQRGITHIVNCLKELPCHFEGDFVYLWLKMEDLDLDFAAEIPTSCEFIEVGRQEGKVMVHCTGGVSRSPAVILEYLCHVEGSLEAALNRLNQAVPTGIDESFQFPLGRSCGVELTKTEVRAFQGQLLTTANRPS